jgi:hypothetical protein
LIHKFIKKVAVACTFSSLLICPAVASTWNTFAKAFNTETALFFFDADTVQKQTDNVTIWIKYVNTVKPDLDGSWATAARYTLTCSKRKSQILTSSIYDKDGKFIRSYPNPGKPIDIAPDSILEEILTATCQPDFPRNKSREFYFAVKDNDIFAHTKRFMEYIESQKDAAPK